MRLSVFILSLLLCASLTGCGLKRNLELPGHEKHTKPSPDSTEPDTDTSTITPDPVAPTGMGNVNAPAAAMPK